MAMNYIILDLEWNQAADKSKEISKMPFEVIEIGAVKADKSGCIIDEFECLIRPTVYPELYYRVKELVGISKEELEREGKSFEEGIREFINWCGEDYMFCTWGCMDLAELQKNLAYHEIENPFPFPLLYYDIQKLYSLQYGDGKTRCSLETAIDELGFWTGEPFHRAEADAYYTGLVMGALQMKKLEKMVSIDYFRVPSCKEEEIYMVFDTYSKFVSMPYLNREEAMKEQNITSTVCYRCGHNVKRRVNWFSDGAKHSYSLSYCPEHGWLKGKIRVKKVIGSDQIFIVKTQKLINQTEAANLLFKQEQLRIKRRERRNGDTA